MWSATAAQSKGVDLDELMKSIPCNVKEDAHFLLMEKNFDADKFKEAAKNLKPADGSDWDEETKKRFADLIFKSRKNMVFVAKEMGIPMKTTLAYYLGTFKASDGYRLLKTVCCEERIERLKDRENGVDACCVCGDGGSLLICDGCEKEYHAACLRPRLAKVPEGEWECDECVARKFLERRDYILENCNLFESRKRSHAEIERNEKEDSEASVIQPRPEVLDAVFAFAKACSEALSRAIPTKKVKQESIGEETRGPTKTDVQ